MGRKSVWIKAEFSFCSPLFIPLFSTYCPHVFLIFLHYVFHMVWIRFCFVVWLFCCFVDCINNQTTYMIWLEASTERSESNPGRSLGIITSSKKSCLEDSTMTSISIRVNPLNPCSKTHRGISRTRIKRIQRMLR